MNKVGLGRASAEQRGRVGNGEWANGTEKDFLNQIPTQLDRVLGVGTVRPA